MTPKATIRNAAVAALAIAGGLALAAPDASAFSGQSGARPASGRMAQSSVAGANRTANANVNRNNNVNRNTNINRNNNINIDRDVDIDVDVDHGYGWGPRYPVAAGIVIGAVAVTHAAVVGSYYYSLPPSGCTTVIKNGITYYYCGSVYYQRSWYGNDVVYVVVNP